MKTRSQKLISLVLVLMMLVTMIPVGIFGASAVSAELEAALADYDNSAEFVVNNTADWEAIATSGKTFSGKTVKLGADLDFEGANTGRRTINTATASGPDKILQTRSNKTLSPPCSITVIATHTNDGKQIKKLIMRSFSLEYTLSMQSVAITPEEKPIISAG